MHFGGPVVPDEYITNKGWLKGSCSNDKVSNDASFSRNDDNVKL